MPIKSSRAGDSRTPRSDLLVATIIGFFLGALAIPVLINLGIKLGWLLWLMPATSAAIFATTLFLVYIATTSTSPLYQFAKFGLVGALNSGIDLGIVNSLILATGFVSGLGFLGIKSASATLSVANSYLFNRYWTFERLASVPSMAEFLAFLGVSLVGIALNLVGAQIVVNVIGAPSYLSPKLWANVGALSAGALTTLSNFFGYKFFVFRIPRNVH